MAAEDSLTFNLRAKDHATPIVKGLESAIIRTVGAVSAAIAGLAAFAFPLKAAADLQQQMLAVKKTTDLSFESITLISKGLVALSTQTNTTAVDLGKIAEAGGRMGIQDKGGVEGLLEFTKQVSILSTALDLSAEEVATSMGKLSNIFSLTTDQFAKAGSVINQLDNESTATASEIFDIMRRIGNLGGSVRFDQSAALSAVAVDLGLTAETAGTTLTKIFADMKSQAKDFASFMGVTTQEWVNSVNVDGIGALRNFVNQLNKMPAEVAAASKVQLTGGGRIFEFITKLQGQVAQGSSSILDRTLTSAEREMQAGTSALKEQQSVLTGLNAQWQVFINKLTALAVSGGGTLLYDLTQALIKVGDYISKQEFLDVFAEKVRLVGDRVAILVNAIVSFASATSLEWTQVFDIAGLLVGIKLLESARVALIRLAAAKGLRGIAAPESVIADEAKREGGGSRTREVAGLAREQSAVSLLTSGWRAYKAQQKEVQVATEAATAARLANAEAVVSVTRAESNLSAVRQKLSNAGARVKAADSAVQTAAAPLIAAQNYYISRVAAQQAQVQAREAAHQQALAAVTGRGAASIRATLQASYDAQTAALAATHARQRAQYQVHYERLIAQNAAAMSALQAATTAQARAGAGFARAKAQLGPSLEAVPDARRLQVETAAALAAAEEVVNKSTLKGKIRNLLSFQEGGGLGRLSALLTAPFAAYATATTTAAKASVVFSGSLNLVANSALFAGRALVGVVSVIGRLLGFVTKVYIFYEIGVALLNATGLMGKFVEYTNKAIEAVNKFTGLKIPTIGGSDKEDTKTLASLEDRKKLLEESAIAADKFNKVYGTLDFSGTRNVDVGKSVESFDAQIVKRSAKIKEDINRIFEGVKFDAMKGNQTLPFLNQAIELVRTLNSKIVNTNALFEQEAETERKLNEKRAEASARERAAHAERLKFKRDLEEELSPTAKVLTGNFAAAFLPDARNSLQEKQNEAIAREVAARKEINDITAQLTVIEVNKLQYTKENISLIQDRNSAIAAGMAALGKQALVDFWTPAVEGEQAFVDKIHDAVAEVEVLTKATAEAEKKLSEAKANDKPDTKVVAELTNNYLTFNAQLSKVKENYESLMTSAENLSSVQELAGDKNRRQWAEAIVNMGRANTVLDASIAKTGIQERQAAALSLLQGRATVNNQNNDSIYRALLGQRLLAKDAASAYRQLAEVATAAADKAKRAVTEAMDKARSDMAALKDAAISSAAQLRQNVANAALVKSGREVDQDTARKIAEIDIEYDGRLRILNVLKEQGQLSEAMFARRKLELDQDKEKETSRVTDSAADAKARDNAKQQIKIFEEEKAKVTELETKLSELAGKMSDVGIPADERAKLIEPFQTAMTEVEAHIKVMANAKTAIEGLATSNGLPPVPRGTLDSMQEALRIATEVKNVAGIEAAKPLEQIFSTQASKLQQGAKAAEAAAEQTTQAITEMSNRLGFSMEKASEDLAKLSTDPAFVKIQEEFKKLAAEGSIKIGVVGFDKDAFSKRLAEVADAMKDQNLDISTMVNTVPLQKSLKEVAEQFRKDLTAPTKDATEDDKKTKLEVSLSVDAAAEKAKLTSAMGTLALDAQLIVREIIGADGTVTKVNTVVQKRAAGGMIFGPGSTDSDSVPALLSHGEYVSDAFTTRVFGSKFFEGLKSFAKSGNPLGVVDWLVGAMPAPSAPAFSVAAAAPSGNDSSNMASLDITIDRRPIGKVVGKRSTLAELVDTIAQLSRGV